MTEDELEQPDPDDYDDYEAYEGQVCSHPCDALLETGDCHCTVWGCMHTQEGCICQWWPLHLKEPSHAQ